MAYAPTADWLAQFLKDNPGDEGRAEGAFNSDPQNLPGYQSGGSSSGGSNNDSNNNNNNDNNDSGGGYVPPATMEQLNAESFALGTSGKQLPETSGAQLPPPQAWLDQFLADNPGDEGRATKAYYSDPSNLSTPFPGRSFGQNEANDYYQKALDSGISQEQIDAFLARDPNDYNRIIEAFADDNQPKVIGGPDQVDGVNQAIARGLVGSPLSPSHNGGADFGGPWGYTGGTGGGGGGTGGGGTGGGGFQFDPTMFGSLFGSPNTPNDLSGLTDASWNINEEGPGAGMPISQVPGVNLNNDIDSAILSILRGRDASTTQTDAAIQNLLSTIGQGPNKARLTQRNLTAAENAHLGQQGLGSQVEAQLADAGVNSLPGVPQGLQTAGERRVAERIAVPFAQQLRENSIQESELADTRELNALQLATGWSGAKATRVLQAAAAGTDRQRILSEIALGTLDRNIVWNQFLANFGLDRERLANDIEAGRMDRVGMILTQFSAFLAQLRGGYVGN